MNPRLAQSVIPLLITLFLLILLEIITSSLLPGLGLGMIRIEFHVLFVLFLALYLDSPFTALFVLAVEMVHGAFSVQSWALGTFCGVVLTLLITQLKEFIHLKSAFVIMFVTFLFRLCWFVCYSLIFYFKLGDNGFLWPHVKILILDAGLLTLLSPFFFMILEKIWSRGESGQMIKES